MGKSLKKGSAEALRPGAQSHTYPSLKQSFVKKDNAGHTRLALSLEPPLLQSEFYFFKIFFPISFEAASCASFGKAVFPLVSSCFQN